MWEIRRGLMGVKVQWGAAGYNYIGVGVQQGAVGFNYVGAAELLGMSI